MQRISLPRPSAILDGQEAARAVHWQSFIISAIKNVAINLDILLAIRPSQQPNVTCSSSASFQSPHTKPISVKQKSCPADLNIPFLRGWVLWEPTQFGLTANTSTQQLQEKGFKPIDHRVPLRDIITGFSEGHYALEKVESENHSHRIYFKTPIAANGNDANIYRVNLAEGENPSEDAQIKNKLSTTPRAGYETFRNNFQMNNIDIEALNSLFERKIISTNNWEMLFPIYFQKKDDQLLVEQHQFEPIQLLGYQGKPITSDLDLRFIGLPMNLIGEESCTTPFDAEKETKLLLKALKDIYAMLEQTKKLATSYDQISKKENFVEFVKNTGYLTAFELCVLLELNQAIEDAFQKECRTHLANQNENLDFSLGEIFRHGPDNRNPNGISPYSPNEVIVVPRPNPSFENQENENVTLICVTGEENIAKLINIAFKENIWYVDLDGASSQTNLLLTRSNSSYMHGLLESPDNEDLAYEKNRGEGYFRLFSTTQPRTSEEKGMEKKPCCSCTLQ